MVSGADGNEPLKAVGHPDYETTSVIGPIDCAVDSERLAVKLVSRINYRDGFRRANVFPDGGSCAGLFSRRQDFRRPERSPPV